MDPLILLAALVLDTLLGDPVYPFHPIRLLGGTLSAIEGLMFRRAASSKTPERSWWNRRPGGVVLGLVLMVLALAWWAGPRALLTGVGAPVALSLAWDLYVVYSLLALGDLVAHGRRIARAAEAGDTEGARQAVSHLVGRDLDRMDLDDCCRAGVESLSENLCDGVVAPLFWFGLGGIPGLITFKVASTMDSMVGYLSPRYRHFGWFGARLDDVMNWVPARITAALIVALAWVHPRLDGPGAWRCARDHHRALPGFNSGWPEMAAAGALGLRLIGPIYKGGTLVTEAWLGPDSGSTACPPAALRLMMGLCLATGWIFGLAMAALRLGLSTLSGG